MKRFMLIAAILFMQGVYSQCIPNFTKPCCRQRVVCQPVYKSWQEYCYWQRYCQAERGWYETMQYPSFRTWNYWSQLTR